MILDIRRKGITLDMATKLLMSKLEGHLKRADEIRISLLRDEDEN
jgi:hypothetical protein